MNRLIFLLTVTVFCINSALSQTVDDAVKKLEGDQFTTAKSMLTELVSKTPDARALFYLGEVYYQTENLDSASFYYQKGITAFPKNGLSYAGLGKLLLVKGEVDAAFVQLQKALDLAKGKDTETAAQVAWAYLSVDKKYLTEAHAAINGMAKAKVKSYMLDLAQGDAFLAGVEAGKAMSAYEHAAEKMPGAAIAYVKMADVMVMAQNTDEALRLLSQALSADASFAPVYRKTGDVYFLQNKYAKAIEQYEQYVSMSRDDVDAKIRYVKALFLARQYDRVVATASKMNRLQNPVLQRLYAYSLYETGNYPEGLNVLSNYFSNQQAAGILPTDYEYMARLQIKNNLDSLAIGSFKKALEINPTNVSTQNELGMLLMKTAHYDEAARLYESKIKSAATPSVNDLLLWGKAHYFAQHYQVSDSIFALLPAENAVVANLWQARSKQGLDKDMIQGLARTNYETLITLATDENRYKKELSEANEYLGYYYLLQKDWAKSKTLYSRVLQLEPNNTKAREALDSLNKLKK